MFLLDPLLRSFIKQGHLRVTDHNGADHHYGDISAPVDAAIRIHDAPTEWRIARNPAFQIGEAYLEGQLTLETGTLLSFLGLMALNLSAINTAPAIRFLYQLEEVATLPAIFNWASRSRRNVKHHYDLSGALFSLFLDNDRQYSCAYYRSAEDALGIVRLQVALAGTDVVEEHDLVVVLERRRHEAPHVLVAAESVREQHGLLAASRDLHVVAANHVLRHRALLLLSASARLRAASPARSNISAL
jgi:hypothetical protein